ncbi:hypothetical protein [Streptomyces sp. CRN 30]|uniref:hypothetical protein n=1 Tax=Streptomyces sp. CRN 30 TaxID=3075613 RepID=UPI002A7FC970|nr:hypothetical protein [Streptomyces sp. CRN 30]
MSARSASRRAPRASKTRKGTLVAMRFGRLAAMGTVAALILVAGVWASWGTAQHVMLSKGREQGTMKVTECGGDVCSGPYAPVSAGSEARDRVVIEDSVAVDVGRTYPVAVKPGGTAEVADVVRTGSAGLLYAWVPLGGALLLASVVVAGGLRMNRSAWVLGGLGLALITAAFVSL